MPSTVTSLFDCVGLSLRGAVQWKTPTEWKWRVYRFNLRRLHQSERSGTARRSNGLPSQPGLHECPHFKLPESNAPAPMCFINRLAGFWLSDENIVYIGKATSLRGRVGDYYRTPLGDPRPHAGGHWVKTLANLGATRVYFAETTNPEEAEQRLLETFIRGTSEAIRKSLFDPSLPLRFANLEFPPGTRKRHGIASSNVPRGSLLR